MELSSTKLFTNTRGPTRTKPSTYTPTRVLNLTEYYKDINIVKLLINNDDLDIDASVTRLFYMIDRTTLRITYPKDSRLCQLNCGTVSWDNRYFITLYKIYKYQEAAKEVIWLHDSVLNAYTDQIIFEVSFTDPNIGNKFPNATGWGYILITGENEYTDYFATYYGPYIILIRIKNNCMDGCFAEYPDQIIHLVLLQINKITLNSK
jgi:hypothetical protein